MSVLARSALRASPFAFRQLKVANNVGRTYTTSSITTETLVAPTNDRLRTRDGDILKMHYTGTFKADGNTFDSSHARGEPFEFKLGAGQVIRGWDQGLQGMGVGERRKLTLPPAYAYGPRGSPPEIPPNATLVFDVELLEIKNRKD